VPSSQVVGEAAHFAAAYLERVRVAGRGTAKSDVPEIAARFELPHVRK
jgi:hypothetical protein